VARGVRIDDDEALLGHPGLGSSFEGFAIEQILGTMGGLGDAAFYRTHTGLEIDLVLTLSARRRIGIEIKYTSAPKVTPGLLLALAETGCSEGYVVTAGREAFPLAPNLQATPLPTLLSTVIEPLAGERRSREPRPGRPSQATARDPDGLR
jgi:predicted AAA+ superfamily ATPase